VNIVSRHDISDTSHDHVIGPKTIAPVNIAQNQSDFTGDQTTVPSTGFVSAHGECIRGTWDMSGLQHCRAGTLAVEAFNSGKPPAIELTQIAGFVPQTVNDFET
jgi:hypothetical protein